MIYNLSNINLILSFKKFYLHGKNNYNSVKYNEETNSFILEHANNILHPSFGLSLPFYKEDTMVKSIYTLSFYARSLNNISNNKKFKIYVGNTDKDWIVIDDELTNEFKLFKLTTTFYFQDEISVFGINNPFRIGFDNPCENMIYEIKDINLNNNDNICDNNIIFDVKIFYHEIYISKQNYSIVSCYNLPNYLLNYNTNKNILLLPYDFLLNNYININENIIKINDNDVLIILEPPPIKKNDIKYTNVFNKMLSDLNILTDLFKTKCIYYYELPCGYENHMWKLELNFLNKFNYVFSQIGQIIDYKKYFWVPCRSYFLDVEVNMINFKNKKLLCNCPISSGYNIKRVQLIKKIAYKYNIDIYGQIFNNMNEPYIKSKLKHIPARCVSNVDIKDAKLNTLKNYKYVIISENCDLYGYISERIIDIMSIGCIPIYYSENTDFLFSNNVCIINGNDFKDIDEMYNHILNIDENTYNKMIQKNYEYIIKNIKYFTWINIYEYMFKIILNEHIEPDNVIDKANLVLKNNDTNKIKYLKDNKGNLNKYIFN